MKKFIVVIVLLLIPHIVFAHEEKKEPQKFNVTITVEFKSMSLKEIADKEEKLQKLIGDADVTVKFEKNCPPRFTGNNILYQDNMLWGMPNNSTLQMDLNSN